MVTMAQIEEVSRRIAGNFDPIKVILFGSHADGTATEDSDVDLLVVLPFEGKPLRKSLEILNRIDARFALDLLARRPDDVQRRYDQGDPLIREAINGGKVLYERHG
ncbi:MAG TPA: nucleotidyltransferase domain-containing protein [Phycisphaerae bacterium]|nr:nucleotidyltransferase domain-containing protein [Phycisphaerae bacterium]